MESSGGLLIQISLESELKKRFGRFPKFYNSDLAKPFHCLLSHVEEDFLEKRSSLQLARLVSTHYYLRKRLTLMPQQPLLLKCFPSQLEGKRVLSLAFAVHLSHPSEIPEEKHLSLALSRFLPGIKIIPESFYQYLERSSLLLFCYLEIEKPWGNKIASEQIRLLQRMLPDELVLCIRSLTPSLSIPYNQEEVYKNIVQLAKELHSVKDLPQVIITSQAQSRELLCFQIIAVRIKKKSPLRFDHLSSAIRLTGQKIIPLRSPSNLQKEALVFQLEIDSCLFLGRNWTIDPVQARNCIVKTLEQLLGSFKDYNNSFTWQERQEKNSDEPCERKVLRINFQEGDPPSLNPHLAADVRSRILGKALFEGLTRLNSEGVPELAAARGVKISPCQTIYTFFLRTHHWSNGEPVTAHDFEHTWKKALVPDSDCLCRDLFYVIKNAKIVRGSAKDVKVKALNAKTLQVELEHPAFHFLHLIAHPAFSPLYKGEEEPIHFNGPFIVKKWQCDHCLQLTGNPYYWDKKSVSLQEVFISMVKDIRVVSQMFDRKELDWIGDPFSHLPPQEISSHDAKVLLHTKKVDRIYWICLNTLSFPLQSAKIRKALSLAINRKQITDQLFDGYLPLSSPIPNTESKKNWKPDGNIPLARQLFKEGLKELDLTLETFPGLTLHYSATPGQEPLAKMIREQIGSALNITLNLAEVHWNILSNLIDKREYQLVGHFRSPPYFYPFSHLELFRERLHSGNASGWENPDYSLLMEKAYRSSDPKERDGLLKRAEAILLEEMPVIPLFQQVYKYLVHPKIKKTVVYQNGDVDLKFTLL